MRHVIGCDHRSAGHLEPYGWFSLGGYLKYARSLRFQACASICLALLGLARCRDA
jgi:hypothetical protein